MDKYKEIEDLIAFKDCICAKEILNASSMKTDIFENEVVKIDQVIIGELREHYHYIELYFYSFKEKKKKNASLTFNGSLFDLRNFITKLFLPIKNPETLLFNFLEHISIEDLQFNDIEEKNYTVSHFLNSEGKNI